MKRVLSTLLIFFHFSYYSLCQSGPTFSQEDIVKINSYLTEKTTNKQVPGVVAMVANKKDIIYKYVCGINSIGKKNELKIDNIFAIASMTKAVTAVAVMQLFEQGKINLNEPIAKYLPEIGKLKVIDKFNKHDTSYSAIPVKRSMTIHDLLTHTSGIGYPFCDKILAMIEQSGHANKYHDAYMNFPLLHQPGKKWKYGYSYDVLGTLVEKISGITLDKYFAENIFHPIGMNNTFFNVPEEKQNRLTNFYRRMNDTLSEETSFGKQKASPNGGGGLYSTAEDYTKFLQMFLNEGEFNGRTILKKESILEMTKNQIGNLFIETQVTAMPEWSNDFPTRPGKDKFGYGFVVTTNIDNDGLKRKPGSFHWGGLFNTYYWVDPQTGISAVILMQVVPFYDRQCMPILEEFEKLVYSSAKQKH